VTPRRWISASLVIGVSAACSSEPSADGAKADAASNLDGTFLEEADTGGWIPATDARHDVVEAGLDTDPEAFDGGTPDGNRDEVDIEATTPDASDASDGAIACTGPGSRFATEVTSHRFGDGQDFGRDKFPANIFGSPKGGGCCMGSLDVVALGNGGTVTVAFAGNAIVDGAGPDFLVFENAFTVGSDPSMVFAEPGSVEVSQDGVRWHGFPCTATQYPYGTCAGWHPVFANPDAGSIDPTDPMAAGGDPFDLADLGLAWARFVRVTDRPDDGAVFDLDAFAIVHPACP
jgi:hypothetical protein